jgi:hypothetical protein
MVSIMDLCRGRGAHLSDTRVANTTLRALKID